MYDFKVGKYALHRSGCIVKIELYSVSINPQELHFKFRGSSYWAYHHDFILFAKNKLQLKKRIKKFYKDIRWLI